MSCVFHHSEISQGEGEPGALTHPVSLPLASASWTLSGGRGGSGRLVLSSGPFACDCLRFSNQCLLFLSGSLTQQLMVFIWGRGGGFELL